MGSSVDILLAVAVVATVATVCAVRMARAGGDRRDRVIASFAGLRLTETALLERHGNVVHRHPLAGLHARVEIPGPGSTAPRAVVLSVHGPRTVILKAVSFQQYPRAAGEARAFAARCNLAVRLAETAPSATPSAAPTPAALPVPMAGPIPHATTGAA